MSTTTCVAPIASCLNKAEIDRFPADDEEIIGWRKFKAAQTGNAGF
jgi:hypothetical protein